MKNLLIIPAAGNASRLNINYPKIFIKISKKLRLIDLLLSRIKVEKIIFVIKKKDINIFKNHLKNKYKTLNYELVVQNKAKGMADAVLSSSRKWSGYQKIIILWGDQIGISKNTLNKIIKHKVRIKNILLPLVYKKNLYVEYIFKKKKLVAINEYRENDNISNKGFSDVGLFAFSSYNLKKNLLNYCRIAQKGSYTGEISFIKFLVYLIKHKWIVKIINVKNKKETVGINTKKELDYFRKKYVKK